MIPPDEDPISIDVAIAMRRPFATYVPEVGAIYQGLEEPRAASTWPNGSHIKGASGWPPDWCLLGHEPLIDDPISVRRSPTEMAKPCLLNNAP